MKIVGLIVLYNPGKDVWENINTYLNDIEVLYVIDNSEKYNLQLIEQIEKDSKILYVNNYGNKGIAAALNLGAEIAIKDGYDWLLTMDQDSSATYGMINRMSQFIEEYEDIGYLAILSPYHLFFTKNLEKDDDCFLYKNYEIKYQLSVMTSGNLLNLSLYPIIGKFEEKLFIDYVDHEYCLRSKSKGYKIITLCDVFLNHQLGDFKRINLPINIYSSNHNYVRRYYITRNRLYIYNKYKVLFPEFCWDDRKVQLKEWIKIIIGEKDKMRKIISIIRGINDFHRGKFGRYDYN